MKEAILAFDGVRMMYHTRTKETLAAENMSFSIYEGEFVAVIGPSGCGKTTVLSLAAGLLSPSAGSVCVRGKKVHRGMPCFGYMLQKDELLPWRTNMGNILLGAEIKKLDRQQIKEKAVRLLEKYDLAGVEKHYPTQLSGGMRQRIALIRTLVLAPQIILLDEPFSALDFQTRLQVVGDVYNMLHEEEMTAVFVTHDINEAISMCDRVAVLSSKPCRIKKMVDISEFNGIPPSERRLKGRFLEIYDEILRTMQSDTE